MIAHAATDATRRGAFPRDEPLHPEGARDAAILAASIRAHDRALVSPALRARETAGALNLKADVAPLLADLDCGRWSGELIADIAEREPDAMSAWLSDPDANPHGGESVSALHLRVARFLSELDEGAIVAVTHAAVIRAALVYALAAPLESFWQVDVAPLSVLRLHGNGETWRLRALVDRRDR